MVNNKAFSCLDYLTFWKLYRWDIHRHVNKGKKWVKSKYFQTIGDKNWVFATRQEFNPITLIQHTDFTSKTRDKLSLVTVATNVTELATNLSLLCLGIIGTYLVSKQLESKFHDEN